MTRGREVQLAIPGTAGMGRPHPAARRAQNYADAYDDALTALARTRRPSVLYWWGMRQMGPAYGALCYVCGDRIATWARKYPMTQTAKDAVDVHRGSHAPEVTEWQKRTA